MDFSIEINTIYISRGHRLKFSNNYVLQSLKIVFILANSAGTVGLHCLPKYPFKGFQYTKG